VSGLAGLWNLDGRPAERDRLGRMSRALAHRGGDAAGLWSEGAAGLACQLARSTPESAGETQPLVSPSGAALVFDGRLDNRDELLASLRSAAGVSQDAPDAMLALAAYEVFGEAFAERLNGDFALALFDRRKQCLLLARDAVGVRPLYYCRAGDSFLFASEIKALLTHPRVSPRPNDDLLAEFLLGGPARDDRGETFFADVFSVRPGHLVVVTREGARTRRYWDFDAGRALRFKSFSEYAEGFRHHFERAVRRRLRSAAPVAVSVSGGLDSSSIFCVAETLRRREPGRHPSLLGLSYSSTDGSPSDETVFLEAIERDYGIALERFSPQPPGFLDGCEAAVWHTEAPMLDGMWNNTRAFLAHVRGRGARVLLAGHWGDQVLFGQSYLIDLVRRGAWLEAWKHLQEFPRWLTDADPAYFRRTFARELLRELVPERLLPLARKIGARWNGAQEDRPWYTPAFCARARRSERGASTNGLSYASRHTRALYHLLRSRYHAFSMEWQNKVAAQHGLEAWFPLLDRDLIAFLLAIPGEAQNWQGVPRAILRQGLRGALPEAIARRTSKGDYTHWENAGMKQDYDKVVRRLNPQAQAVRRGYVDGAAVGRELAQLRERIGGPRCDGTWRISDLFALELWLDVFFGEGNTKREATRSDATAYEAAD